MRSQVFEVVWRDAFFDYDGEHLERRDYLNRTVGYLVGEDDLFIRIAQEIQGEGQIKGVTAIPKGPTLLRMTPLKRIK